LSLGFYSKYHPDGTVDKYKARLVARDFTQTYRVDYLEAFSPVDHLNSIRVGFSLVVNQQWHLDVSTRH